MAFLSTVVAFAARALLVMLFLPFSALDKILNFKQAVGQAAEAVPNRSLATALIFAGFGVEFFMSLAILTGIADRMAAVILAGYCVVTALLVEAILEDAGFSPAGSQPRTGDVLGLSQKPRARRWLSGAGVWRERERLSAVSGPSSGVVASLQLER